jgi:Putative bacterial sensory transduction regulator
MFRSLSLGCLLLVSGVMAFAIDQPRADTNAPGSAPEPPASGPSALRLVSAPPSAPWTDAGAQPAPLYQTVTSRDLLGLLQAAGYEANIDQNGNINFKVNAVKTFIHPYNCDDSQGCKSFGYYVGFSNRDIPVELINEYNLKRRWGHAYLNNGRPMMAWDVLLDGGVTYQYLVRSLDMWRDLIGSFAGALNSKVVQ